MYYQKDSQMSAKNFTLNICYGLYYKVDSSILSDAQILTIGTEWVVKRPDLIVSTTNK